MVNSSQICIAAYLLLRLIQAAVVYEDPVDMTVELNKWTQINCTVNCGTHNVGWYIAGHTNAIKNNSIPGLAVMRPEQQCSVCISDQKTCSFRVFATEALNKPEIAIYCAAHCNPISDHPECRTHYSRPALLTVKAAGTIALSTISRTPEISPSPLLCPTHTLQETTSPAVVTLAITVTSSPTNCPTPATTSSSTGQVSSVSAASTKVTCAQVTVLAGLVIAAILL